jgi:polyisoprenoid-binding protein YceI
MADQPRRAGVPAAPLPAGTWVIDPDHTATLDAATITTGVPKRDDIIRSAEFLDAAETVLQDSDD